MGKDGRSGASNLSIPPRIAMQSSDFSYVPLPVSYSLHPMLPLAHIHVSTLNAVSSITLGITGGTHRRSAPNRIAAW